jgi:hypothetical protein
MHHSHISAGLKPTYVRLSVLPLGCHFVMAVATMTQLQPPCAGRQWESFSCVNVDSVHNDGERHLAYLNVLGGNGTASKMRAWAAGALPDGMIQEQLACGCMDSVPPKLDQACGRVMGAVLGFRHVEG